MSNILPEDVKLMAKFDGITDRFCMCDRHKYAHKLSTCMPGLIPNYPKDMNALLVVMDKIGSEKSRHIMTEVVFNASTSTQGILSLPKLLFIELVEAIKQIKESE